MLVHSDGGSYKPLNWMSPPCTLVESELPDGAGPLWTVTNKTGDQLLITVEEVLHDSSHALGIDPGLVKDGVEAHLQVLLAEQIETLGAGLPAGPPRVPDAIGPVDIMARDATGVSVAVEIKRRGDIDGVEQLTATWNCSTATRCWRRCAGCSPPRRSSRRPALAKDRGMRCLVLDYDPPRARRPTQRLF